MHVRQFNRVQGRKYSTVFIVAGPKDKGLMHVRQNIVGQGRVG